MKKQGLENSVSRCASLALLVIAATPFTACDNDLIVSPTVTGIDLGPGSIVGVTILANLRTENRVCQEATLFYDGQELEGARTLCLDSADGCAALQLEASAPIETGSHAIGIEILRQRSALSTYEIDGEVLIGRSGIPPVMVLTLEPRVRELQIGERVTYEVHIPD